MGEHRDGLLMNKIVKPLGGMKCPEKENLEVSEMKFIKFTVLSRVKAVLPSPNAV